ncbi:hypothetical protein LSH36_1083g00003 [Paralvinella palmiformis]|uniref:Transmembrane protein n=1 Tax=Paralvinella palmiformis TaxID=53620 RepID=A0AAD9MRV6_9ANNE|nr:hypothetical protein LSH36_1083g00003 [Paralvinella palmiformis]
MKTRNNCCQAGSFIFLLMSLLGFVIAFSSTYWLIDGNAHYGLWKVCTGDLCAWLIGSQLVTAAFISSQVIFCLSLALGVVSFGGHIAWLIKGTELTSVISWVGQLAAVILWGNETFRYFGGNILSWSYWVMLSSAILMAVSGGITACKTGCGTRLERDHAIVYSATAAARGAAGTEAFLSDSNELSNYSDNDYRVAPPSRSHGEWGDDNIGKSRY